MRPARPISRSARFPFGICQQGTCRIPAELGGPCADDYDCNRDLLCDASRHSCVDPVRPGLGGNCIRDVNGGKPALLCQPNLFCNDGDNLGTPGVCSAFELEGKACQYHGCAPGLECFTLDNPAYLPREGAPGWALHLR